MASVELAGHRLDYLLKRSSARRSLSLRVNREGMAQVNAPWSMPQSGIERFLYRHADWLRGQLDQRQGVPLWSDGMRLPYLGGELRLAWRPSVTLRGIREQGGILHCVAHERDLIAMVTDWYRSRAAEVLADRLARVCARLRCDLPAWRLSDARTRWGSLSAKGVVSLNWRLIKASPAVVDYVICHELAHFRQRNHSPAFWREVAAFCPEYQSLRLLLRRDGARYLDF